METPMIGMKNSRRERGTRGSRPKGRAPLSARAPTDRTEPSSIGSGRPSARAVNPPDMPTSAAHTKDAGSADTLAAGQLSLIRKRLPMWRRLVGHGHRAGIGFARRFPLAQEVHAPGQPRDLAFLPDDGLGQILDRAVKVRQPFFQRREVHHGRGVARRDAGCKRPAPGRPAARAERRRGRDAADAARAPPASREQFRLASLAVTPASCCPRSLRARAMRRRGQGRGGRRRGRSPGALVRAGRLDQDAASRRPMRSRIPVSPTGSSMAPRSQGRRHGSGARPRAE